MEDYRKMSDEGVIERIRRGDRQAVEYLMDKYKDLVRKRARTLFLIGGERDDLIQEGMIGLFKAIQDYLPERDSSFYHFAELCIARQMYTAIKSSNTQKNQPLNNYVSFDSPEYGENSQNPKLGGDPVFLKKISNPEQFVLDKEYANVLEYELVRRLSDFEKQVLNLYMKDYSYYKISEVLGRDVKSIDNALSRVRGKVNDVLKDMSSR